MVWVLEEGGTLGVRNVASESALKALSLLGSPLGNCEWVVPPVSAEAEKGSEPVGGVGAWSTETGMRGGGGGRDLAGEA